MSKWISLYEKMPENNKNVLVTVKAGTETDAGTACVNQTLMAMYFADDEPFPYFSLYGYGDKEYRDEIIAWMPLPEPYEEEG